MAATLGLVLDCADPDRLAESWSAAIGDTTLGGAGTYVLRVDADGKQPKSLLQRVDEPESGKNRMHVDIVVDDVETEVHRLLALGARRIDDDVQSFGGTRWVRMSDPEQNEFCVSTGVEW